jgi:Putative peptidoglycan binding domain
MRTASTSRSMNIVIATVLASFCLPHAEARADSCASHGPEKCDDSYRQDPNTCITCRWAAQKNVCEQHGRPYDCATVPIEVQNFMSNHGHPIKPNASKAEVTTTIKAFQTDRFLKPTGIIDKETLKALREP